MSLIKFKIDEKSLWYGIVNDYSRGQTATVSTPINQAADPSKWHHDIMQLFDTNLDIKNIPETLIDKCLKKTTSDAEGKLEYFYKFDNIYYDNKKLNTNASFAMFVKKEISTFIINREGKKVLNTHNGRLMLRYPTTFKYIQDGFNVDNKQVLDDITNQNGGFAIVVRGFEVNTKTKSLNILTSMIGIKDVVLLSNVFKRQKGVGKKLLLDELDIQEVPTDLSKDEIIALAKHKQISGEDYFDNLNKIRARNGKVGEEYVIEHIKEILCPNAEDIYHTSADYPTSPYDIEYTDNGIKKYVEVKSSSGSQKKFNMSSGEIKFMDKYDENYILVLVTDLFDKFPTINKYNRNAINKMKKSYPKVVFTAS